MNNNETAALIMARVAMLNADIAGMQARNQHRLGLGHSIAYDREADIKRLEAENRRLRDELQNTRLSDFSPEVQEKVAFRLAYVAAWDAEWRAQQEKMLRNIYRERVMYHELGDQKVGSKILALEAALMEAVALLREGREGRGSFEDFMARLNAFIAAHEDAATSRQRREQRQGGVMLTEDRFFSDESIVEQSTAMIEDGQGKRTNGVSIMVAAPKDADAVEVLLEYDELKAAIAGLKAEREAMPQFYGAGRTDRRAFLAAHGDAS